MKSGLILTAMSLVLATTAQAQQILSAGTIYGGPAQARVVCYFYNSGTSAVSLAGTRITDHLGNVQVLAINQCGANLPAGQSCGIAANAAGNTPYACRTVVSPNKTNTRGILEVRNSSQVTLQNVELR